MDKAILDILIRAQDQASATIKEIGGEMDKATKNAGDMSKAFQVAGGILTGVGVAGALAMKGWVEKSMEASAITTQLNAVLKSTGGMAGVTKDKALELADSLSQVTKFDDEAILSGENMLLTFTNIGKNIFPTATETILNMSTALGTDLKGSAIQLGKALNDPIAGISALSRVGVKFTEDQKKMIEGLVKAGKLEDAQKVILKELETEFGGSAKAAGEGLGGQLAILKTNMDNVQESLGDALVPMIKEVAVWLKNLARTIQQMNPDTIKFIAMTTLLVTAFGLIFGPILLLIGMLPAISEGFTILAGGALLPAIGIIIALVAVCWLAYEAFKNWDKIKKFFSDLGIAIAKWATDSKTAIGNFFTGIGVWFTGLITSITTFFSGLWAGIVAFFTNIYTSVIAFFTGVGVAISAFIQGVVVFFTPLFEIIRGIVAIIVGVFTIIFAVIFNILSAILLGVIVPIFTAIFTFIWTTLTNIYDFFSFTFTLIYLVVYNIFTTVWNYLVSVFDAIYNGVIVPILTAIWNTFVSVFTTIWNFLSGIFMTIYNWIKERLMATATTTSGVLDGIWKNFTTAFTGVKNTVVNVFTQAYDWLSDKLGGMWTMVTDITDKIWKAFTDMADGVMKALRTIKFPKLTIGEGVTNVAGMDIKYPKMNVDWYEKGGWVQNTGLAVVHEGEFVLSKNMLRGNQSVPSNVTNTNNSPINIYANINTEVDLDLLAYKLAYVMRNK